MKMRRSALCSVRNKHRNTWGMKTLKMCFGKGHLKSRETIEQGKKYNVCIEKLNSYKLITYNNYNDCDL